jgi:hypothetical protein
MFLFVSVTTEQGECLAAAILTSLTTLHVDTIVRRDLDYMAVKTILIDLHALERSPLISLAIFYAM